MSNLMGWYGLVWLAACSQGCVTVLVGCQMVKWLLIKIWLLCIVSSHSTGL
ncbi:hypothetical protein [Endozoicomonas sp. YOMI1]|uniref:hypothetical protein n=1 Tax=Endozoicomonas sp. YOMI1 TaxID=2828739 RepID=UPI0021491536|nr:hypothetical protein [Endozoicomonas sp. YOMI1]